MHWDRGALLGLLVLGGCHLVDQTSFGDKPRGPAGPEMAAAFASDGRLPLLTIRPDDRIPYADGLRQAIDQVEARDGNGRFRLVTVVPVSGDIDHQAALLDAAQSAARGVLDDMGADGISPDRVSLSGRSDPHVTRPELWLFGS